MAKKLYLGIGDSGNIQGIRKWAIEDFNREDVIEQIVDEIYKIYDGEYDYTDDITE